MPTISAIIAYLISASSLKAAPFVNKGMIEDAGARKNVDALTSWSGLDKSFSMFDMVKLFIDGFLSLAGIVFICMVLWAGYKWFSANGDDAKVKDAKKILSTSVIGLLFTGSIYAITYFVFNSF